MSFDERTIKFCWEGKWSVLSERSIYVLRVH